MDIPYGGISWTETAVKQQQGSLSVLTDTFDINVNISHPEEHVMNITTAFTVSGMTPSHQPSAQS